MDTLASFDCSATPRAVEALPTPDQVAEPRCSCGGPSRKHYVRYLLVCHVLASQASLGKSPTRKFHAVAARKIKSLLKSQGNFLNRNIQNGNLYLAIHEVLLLQSRHEE